MKSKIAVDKKRLRDAMSDVLQEEVEKAIYNYTKVLCYVLNEYHGFGKERLARVFDGTNEAIAELNKDEEGWYHLNKRLQQIGVDLKPKSDD